MFFRMTGSIFRATLSEKFPINKLSQKFSKWSKLTTLKSSTLELKKGSNTQRWKCTSCECLKFQWFWLVNLKKWSTFHESMTTLMSKLTTTTQKESVKTSKTMKSLV